MDPAGWWREAVLPRVVDLVLADSISGRWREAVCGQAHGEVLELGFGSGLNLPYYPPTVTRVLAVEPAELAWARSAQRRRTAPMPVTHVGLDGARLQLPDSSVDTVVSTFTLCTIADLAGALAQVCRVLRPGGTMLFAEHSLATGRRAAQLQRRLQPLWGPVAGGCHIDRDIPALLSAANLRVDHRVIADLSAVAPVGVLLRGVARPIR